MEFKTRQDKWQFGRGRLFVTKPLKDYLQNIKRKLGIKSIDATLRKITKEWIYYRKTYGKIKHSS